MKIALPLSIYQAFEITGSDMQFTAGLNDLARKGYQEDVYACAMAKIVRWDKPVMAVSCKPKLVIKQADIYVDEFGEEWSDLDF